jgi:UPF0716 protein FxsA
MAWLAAGTVVELAAFVLVTRWLGLPWTVLLMLATSAVGVLLVRREGVRAWRRFRLAFEAGEPPGVRVADGLVGLVGALLLAVPGFVTDVVGLLLLLPFVRPLARHRVQRLAEARMSSGMAGDVFGPRRVRVRYGPRAATPPPAPDRPAQPPPGALPGPVVEGEIVDEPRDDGRPDTERPDTERPA